MTGLIGALRVSLGLDSAQFEAGAKKARVIARREAQGIQKEFTTATTQLSNTLKGLAVAGLASGFLTAAKAALDYSDAIVDLADRTGASTKAIQEFRYAAQMSGSDVATADDAVGKFARTLGLAESGSKKQADLLASLGVTSRDFDTALRQTMDGLAKLPSVAQRNAIALQVFGKSAATLTALMGEGSQGFRSIADEANRYGIVIDEGVLRKAGPANDALDRMRLILDASFAASIADNADALTSLANGFGQIAVGIGGAISKLDEWAFKFKQAVRASIGWTPWGGEASGDAAKGAREMYYREAQARAAQPVARTFASARKAEAARQGAAFPTPASTTGGRSGSNAAREAERRAQEAQRNLERFQDDLARLQEQELSLRQEMSVDLREQAMFEHQRLAMERDGFETTLARRVAEGELTAAQAEALRLQFDQNAEMQAGLVNRQLDERLMREGLDLANAAFDLRAEVLRHELEGARSAAERARIEAALVDLGYQRERATLQAILDLEHGSKVERAIAKQRMDALDGLRSGDQAQVQRRNLGPLGRYIDELPRTAEELNEAYQRVAADGLGSVTDGIADAITGARSLADVFKNVADQIIRDLLRIALQRSIVSALGNSLGGILGGSTSGILPGDQPLPTSTPKLPGFANGGSFMVGGAPGVDRNVLSINDIPQAMVSSGERVTVDPKGGGAGNTYVIKGNLLTPEFWEQIQAESRSGAAQVIVERDRRAAYVQGRQAGR
ncbi:hypothetical protein ACPVPU_12635 [Sphingomonas sp. CJ99]